MVKDQGNETILIVDDDLNNLKMLMDTLRSANFTVLLAQTGAMGYQRACFAQPDLILLDILLPDLDGFALCHRLKADAKTRDIPVIFLSALTNAEEKVTGFQAGAVDYITKPIQEVEVLARVRTHVNLRRLTLAEERRRLSRELHDSVTQSLYSLLLLTDSWEQMAAQGRFDSAQAESVFGQLHQVTQQTYQELRLLIHQLRPALLEKQGLVAALQQRLEQVEQRAGLETDLVTDSALNYLSPNISEQLFYIAQEALNNALRHARATTVTVRICQEADMLSLTVADNGCGFDPACPSAGFGIVTMRERAALIGGTLEICSKPQRGTLVHVTMQPYYTY